MNMWAVALTRKLQMENGEDITKQHFGIHRQNHGGITPSFFMSGVTHGLYTYISIYIIISVQKTLYTVITSNHPANRLSLSLLMWFWMGWMHHPRYPRKQRIYLPVAWNLPFGHECLAKVGRMSQTWFILVLVVSKEGKSSMPHHKKLNSSMGIVFPHLWTP